MNLFHARASWPIPPNYTPKVKMEKTEEKIPPKEAAIPCTLVLNKPHSNKPAEDECRWGLHCPICRKSASKPKAESTEDWNGTRQETREKEWNVLMISTI